jgi:hypothetical protein
MSVSAGRAKDRDCFQEERFNRLDRTLVDGDLRNRGRAARMRASSLPSRSEKGDLEATRIDGLAGLDVDWFLPLQGAWNSVGAAGKASLMFEPSCSAIAMAGRDAMLCRE